MSNGNNNDNKEEEEEEEDFEFIEHINTMFDECGFANEKHANATATKENIDTFAKSYKEKKLMEEWIIHNTGQLMNSPKNKRARLDKIRKLWLNRCEEIANAKS